MKTNTFSKVLAALLAMLMLLPCIVGCAGDNPGSGDTTTAADTTAAPDDAAPETKLSDVLGFEFPSAADRDFNILVCKGYSEPDFCAEDFSGDAVSVEVYARNLEIQDKFGVTLNMIVQNGAWGKQGEFRSLIEKANEAGTYDYDMVAGLSVSMATMLYTGLWANLMDIESVDLSHSWWMKDTVETYGINNTVYGAMGDIAHTYYSSLAVIALNTSLAERFGLNVDDLYKTVYDGNWTLDKMLEIGSAYGEENGDQVMTMGEDTFGLVARTVPSRLFMYGFDIELIQKNEDGEVGLVSALEEKVINSYAKLYNAFNNNVYPNISTEPQKANITSYFANDKILMYTAYFSDLGLETIRNMSSEYMLLPMPKYDTQQDHYITPIATEATMVLIPITAIDPEFSGQVMEYYGYLGQRDITPVYVENTLKIKYASDERMMEMVSYIMNTASFTMSQMLIWNCETPQLRNMYAFGALNAGTESLTSFWQSNQRSWSRQLEILLRDVGN